MAEKEKMVHDTEIALDEHEVRLRDAMNILKAEKDRSCDGDCKLSKKVCLPPLPSLPLPSTPLPLSIVHSPAYFFPVVKKSITRKIGS